MRKYLFSIIIEHPCKNCISEAANSTDQILSFFHHWYSLW